MQNKNAAGPAPANGKKRRWLALAALLLAVAVLVAVLLWRSAQTRQYNATSYAMNTVVTQSAYGIGAEAAMAEVNEALKEWESRLSLYSDPADPTADIARINAAAGRGGAEVSRQTANLLRQALVLSGQSEGAFAITIAPLTEAWGITTAEPRVVPEAERQQLLALVDDSAVSIEGNRVVLPEARMGIDLGGFAKGAACAAAADIYDDHGVDSALLNLGGNVYARGTKPGGEPWRVGFRNPEEGDNSFIASFPLTDRVIAASGGYERYFEIDGKRYIHILDPRTGAPVESDIASVGVIETDGAAADFWSTTLFIWGKEKALDYMRQGADVILLDGGNRLYVSENLREGFRLHEGLEEKYEVIFVPREN